MPEPTLESMRLEIDAARKAFRARARAILFDAYQNADAMAGAIGEVSADQAFEVWARAVREALEAPSPSSLALQEHPLKPSEDADALHPRHPLPRRAVEGELYRCQDAACTKPALIVSGFVTPWCKRHSPIPATGSDADA